MTLANGSSTCPATASQRDVRSRSSRPITAAQLISVYRAEQKQLAYGILETLRELQSLNQSRLTCGELAMYMSAIPKTRL